MDGGHQAALDAEFVIQNLGDRRQAVGGAAGVGDDGLSGIALVVDAVDEHRGRILARRGHDDLLGAGLDMGGGGFLIEEEAGGFDDDVGADFVPLQTGRILFGGQTDAVAVDDQEIAVDGDVAVEDAVDRVVLEHVGQVIGIKQIVDADNLNVLAEVFDRGAEHHTANAPETVDTDFNHFVPLSCCQSCLIGLVLI
ncbi:hypothetical protein SDC9_137478 [bioreactor metagenome]|uniref:Uncharacterized protein n=1 Tax=bioreactor metagenome TaxID=1076179 RepID=A0A645DM46_9ZZZZ